MRGVFVRGGVVEWEEREKSVLVLILRYLRDRRGDIC